jgi:hypothetical protein
MDEPAIKGAVLERSWSQLHELIDAGRITREKLEMRLDRRDLDTLDDKISTSLWYPLSTAVHYSRVIDDVTGETGPVVWKARGAAIAERLLTNSSLAGFFESAFNRSPDAQGATLVKVSPLILNFGALDFEQADDGTGYLVRLTDVEPLPDFIRFVIEGVIETVAHHATQGPAPVESERPDKGTIVYRGRVSGEASA